MKQNERMCRIRAATKYPLLASKVFLLLLFVPTLVVALGDMNGRTMHEALTRCLRMIASPESIFMFWAPIVLCAMIIFGYLSPVLAFECGRSFARNPRQAAKIALKRLNGMNTFIIVFGIVGFSFGELMSQLATGTMGTFTFSGKFMLFSAVSKGLLSSVIISFNLDNILFPAKKAAIEALPEKRLRKTSLYRRIMLVVATIIAFLLFQFLTTATQLYDLGNKLMTLNLSQFDAYRVLEEGPLSADIHNLLSVIYFKGFIYLAFVFELVLQLKYMIQHPLETMKDKLVRLNSDDIGTLNSIDILVNDEFSGVYREINSLIKRQQSELECSSNRLESIVDLAADPIISFDQNGKILLFNPAAERFFGYSGEEALRLSVQAIIEIPEGDDTWCAGCTTAEAIARLLRGERNGISRFSGIRKDGSRAMFESNVSSAESPGATIFTAIIRDISKQIELERGLTDAKVAAENANRLKTEFLANMSHELRTPLNAVLGFTQLLSSDRNLTPGQLEKIAIISRSGEHLLSLINDILDISKIEAGKQEIHDTVFDPTRFVDDIREMFSLRCQKAGLGLYVEISGELPKRVKGDLGKLRQVMINLVGNAVKFTQEGGIGILAGFDGGKIRFSVTDSGKGIPSSELEMIMLPFTQSSITDNEGGTGLGLAISSRYIQMMGGSLSVRSEVGKGSTFSFAIDLPETDEAIPDSLAPETAIAVKKGSSVTALIVDDKEVNRLVLKEMLEASGFLTMEAENGKVAVERTGEFRPALVFMDIKMPVMDGFEAMRAIKQNPATSTIPVFALTASAFVNDEKKILEAGFDGFLAKPFKKSSLFRLIREKSGIELEYETAEIHESKTVPDPAEIDWGGAARELGKQGISRLSDSVLINDFTAVRAFASEIRERLPALSALLEWHAESFDETALESAIRRLER